MPQLYTQFPHPLLRFAMAILEPVEWVCLSYIVDRTRGFVDPAGGRKKADVISLDQFEHGITRLDGRVLDLGTGLARSTIRVAIEGLAHKELITARLACSRPGCGWVQLEGDPEPPPHGKAKSPSCPDCRKSLSKSYGLAVLSAKKLEGILNSYDPKGRTFSWDLEALGYRVVVPEASEKRHREESDLKAEAERLRNLLWYPELVDAAVALAEGSLKAGHKISTSRIVSGFYKPVLELQATYVSAPLIKYSLEQAIAHKVPTGTRSHRWWRYPLTICENNKTNAKFAGAPVDLGTNAAAAKAEAPETRCDALRDLLARAADLNGRGEGDSARALLSDLLADENVRGIAPLFGKDIALADCSLREAFKQGITDFVGIDPSGRMRRDYYPEWEWPAEVPTASARRREKDLARSLETAG